MLSCRLRWATMALLALPLQPAEAQKKTTPPPPLTPFVGHLAEARARARERHVALLVHVVLEDEETNDQYRAKVLDASALLRASAGVLVLVANNGTHPRAKVEVEIEGLKTLRRFCSAYPMFESCGQHQIAWDDLYAELREENGDMRCPQTLIEAPDGTLVERVSTGHLPDVGELTVALGAVVARYGPGLSDAQLDAVLRLLADARQSAAAALWPQAWKAWGGVLELAVKTPYAAEASAEQPKALAGLQAELERLCALLVPGTAADGYRQLTAYAEALAGTPLEKEAASRLKRAERERAIKDEIAAWKLEQEAAALLKQAQDLEAAGEGRKAEHLVRRLLNRKYAPTGAQRTARTLWPEIARETDGPRGT